MYDQDKQISQFINFIHTYVHLQTNGEKKNEKQELIHDS